MSEPGSWLDDRLAGAPPSLRARLVAAGAGAAADAADVAAALRALAETLLAEAKAGPPTRETAMTLLAADALVTLACEWTAEFAPERLGDEPE